MFHPVTHRDTLLSLLVSANRLIRIAAQATGSTTPSAQWRTLGILETDGAMRVGELATASRVTQPGMTRLLATMTEEGLVSRIPDPDDSRAWLVDLTPRGREELRQWRSVISATLEPRFRELGDEEWAALELAARVLASRTAAEVTA
jgi:DNA-binding MarR family transcriptional regulator